MKTYLKVIIGIVAVGVIVGAYYYPIATKEVGAGSSVGTTFNSAKVAQVNISPTNSATSTSILNTDDTDRWVTSNFAACTGLGTSYTAVTGAGLAAVTLTSATTTTSAPATISNTNSIALTVATATPNYMINTVLTTNTLTGLWKSGSYMSWAFNATNTAACTVGVTYLAS